MEFVKKIGQMLPLMFLSSNSKKRAAAVFEEIVLPRSGAARLALLHLLLKASDSWIASLRSGKARMPKHTEDRSTAVLEGSVLDSIARQNDEVREVLRDLQGC